MKKLLLFMILSLCVAADRATAQETYVPIDTAKLRLAYKELLENPNIPERQYDFFHTFPSNWTDFTITYRYLMQDEAFDHIQALNKYITVLPDDLFCQKLVQIAVGGVHDEDAANHFQTILRSVMWRRMDEMIVQISKLRKGHQMQFWEYYWSNNVRSKPIETDFKRLYKLNFDDYPDEMKTMTTAYEYFYNGVNEGGYGGLYTKH